MRKFEQIRAQWELGQSPNNSPPRMVGRKEKAAPPQAANDAHATGPSAFRRKLSRGMSFISHPLSQRKITPGHGRPTVRHGSNTSAASASQQKARDASHELDRLLSPINDSGTTSIQSSPARPPMPPSDVDLKMGNDPHATPRQPPLVRSATMSLIPRPARSNSTSSVEGECPTPRPPPPAFSLNASPRVTPTKIPTPSPPRDGTTRKCSSPRQYRRQQHTAQQEKHIAASAAFAAAPPSQSPSRVSVRSHTTNSLAQSAGVRAPQPVFMMARKQKIQTGSPPAGSRQSSSMKENTPTGRRDSRNLSQVQIKSQRRDSQRRESLVPIPPPATAVANRRSTGPAAGKSLRTVTPTRGSKRLSSQLQTTPLTAKRIPSTSKALSQPAPSNRSNRSSNASSIAQSRLMGPVSPPTPTRADPNGVRAPLPRASTDRDLRRRTFGSPSRLSSSGKSKSMADTKNEVRLPRSSTFSYIPRFRENLPPVPPIPEVVVTPPPTPPRLALYNTPPRKRARTLADLSNINDSQSYLEHLSEFTFDVPAKNDFAERLAGVQESSPFNNDPESDMDSDEDLFTAFQAKQSEQFKFGYTKPPRPFDVNDHGGEFADPDLLFQVRDFMPALWWAGRFQTRFDQWRMDAMQAELDPTYEPEGLLGQCKLSDDRVAACYIFLGLRDLCTTGKAADSLWEFEYKYRQDHKLLGAMVDFPSRKQNENATPKQGAIGRAVRKLTPRKSSLVNLLKGKGWNRADDTTQDLTMTSVSEHMLVKH